MLGNIATDRLTEDADFGKKIIFSDEALDTGRRGLVGSVLTSKQNTKIISSAISS